ncbi:unnamed protein product, partial [Coregonus sp. 'balchen']
MEAEHITEDELAEFFTTLVGLNPKRGRSELEAFECDGMYHHVELRVVSKNVIMRLRLHSFDSQPLKVCLCLCWTDSEDMSEYEVSEEISMETFSNDFLEIVPSSQEGMLSPS